MAEGSVTPIMSATRSVSIAQQADLVFSLIETEVERAEKPLLETLDALAQKLDAQNAALSAKEERTLAVTAELAAIESLLRTHDLAVQVDGHGPTLSFVGDTAGVLSRIEREARKLAPDSGTYRAISPLTIVPSLVALIADCARRVAAAQDAASKSENHVTALQEELRERYDALVQLTVVLASLRKDATMKDQALAHMCEQTAGWKARVSELEQRNVETERLVTETARQLGELRSDSSAAWKTQRAKFEKDLAAERSLVQQLQRSVAAAPEKMKALEISVKDWELKHELQLRNLAALRHEFASERRRLESETQAWREKYTEAENNRNGIEVRLQAEYERKCVSLVTDHSASLAAVQSLADQAKVESEAAHLECGILHGAVQQAEKRASQVEQERDRIQSGLARFHSSMAKMRQESEKWEAECTRAKTQNERDSALIAEKASQIRRLQDTLRGRVAELAMLRLEPDGSRETRQTQNRRVEIEPQPLKSKPDQQREAAIPVEPPMNIVLTKLRPSRTTSSSGSSSATGPNSPIVATAASTRSATVVRGISSGTPIRRPGPGPSSQSKPKDIADSALPLKPSSARSRTRSGPSLSSSTASIRTSTSNPDSALSGPSEPRLASSTQFNASTPHRPLAIQTIPLKRPAPSPLVSERNKALRTVAPTWKRKPSVKMMRDPPSSQPKL